MSENKFKEMIKIKMKENVLDSLNERKLVHSKMENLFYTDLNTQDYLLSDETTTQQKRNLFLFRTRMADFNDNFRGGNEPLPCRICGMHLDSQSHSVKCEMTVKKFNYKGDYNEIFHNNITKETAIFLEQLIEFRKKHPN